MPRTATEITSLKSLEDALTELHQQDLLGGEAMWWRGHAHTGWKLKPGVFRDSPQGAPFNEHALTSSFEKRAVGRLGHRARPLNEIEWLLLAQHYGLPTRLLDWTENPLVALFFAVREEHNCVCGADSEGCLWAISPTKLNELHSNRGCPDQAQKGLVDTDNSVVQAMAKRAFGVKDEDLQESFPKIPLDALPKVLALASVEMDERIVAQTGRFTIHGCDSDVESLEDKDKFLRRFLIPADKKSEIRTLLKRIGIQRWNLFPDLEALATGLKNCDFM